MAPDSFVNVNIQLGIEVTQISMILQHIPAKTLKTEQCKATHTDIWWWLGGRKLHHVAPDVSRLVPGGCGNTRTHQPSYTSTQNELLELTEDGKGLLNNIMFTPLFSRDVARLQCWTSVHTGGGSERNKSCFRLSHLSKAHLVVSFFGQCECQ